MVTTPVAPTPADAALQAETAADLAATDALAAAAQAEQDAAAASVSSAVKAQQRGTTGSSVRSFALAAAAQKQGGGDPTASTLSPSATWTDGGSTGAFTWSYPFGAPDPSAGPAPQLALTYDSGTVDGKTAGTNNQPSWVGEGFDVPGSYVERSYASCRDDGQSGKYDLCWKDANASLVLDGKATQLVRDDSSGAWRLADDDASKAELKTGASNGDADGEYWVITTADGVQYWFGRNNLPGASGVTTKSVFTVPVAGDDDGEPCHNSTFANSFCVQAWRWNLDYVVDLHGNAATYWYQQEQNYYGKNGSSAANSAYVRGGYLDHITYGVRASAPLAAGGYRVEFSVAERCLSSTTNCADLTSAKQGYWPDVPFDSICASGGTCLGKRAPSFFTRKRLTGIKTRVWDALASTPGWVDVDTWAFNQVFLDPGDTGDTRDQTMWLSSVRHTNTVDGAVALAPVRFAATMLPNRVDGPTDSQLPLNKPRLMRVLTESGASINIDYLAPDCSPTSHPALDANTTRCFPSYWYPEGRETPILDWFNKYVVGSVTTAEPFAASPLMTTTYKYGDPSGSTAAQRGAAWRYADDPITPPSRRTWSSWRGYARVTTVDGDPAEGPQSKTIAVYLRGMDGNKTSAGGTASASVTGIKAPAITDRDEFSGFLRESVTYDGANEVSGTISTPWSQQTASQAVNGYTARAFFVREAAQTDRTVVTSSGTPVDRKRTVLTTYDSYGMVATTDDAGDEAKSGDESCTTTWYARSPSINLTSLVSRTQTLAVRCGSVSSAVLPADSTTTGDVIADTATAYDSATTWSAAQTPTLGEPKWQGRASGYASGVPTWQAQGTNTYDALGRVLTTTDSAGVVTTTTFSPSTDEPVRSTTEESSTWPGSLATTTLDLRWGSPIKTVDINGRVSETLYDGLGRVSKVWLPNQPRSTSLPNVAYGYAVNQGSTSWISTATLGPSSTSAVTSYSILDGLLRPRQTQKASPRGGRVVTLTGYNSRGLVVESDGDMYDTDGDSQTTKDLPGTTLVAPTAQPPAQTLTYYDGAGRATTVRFLSMGIQKWSTTTTYTGDSVATTAPSGGTATRAVSDALGRTVADVQYAGTAPSGTSMTVASAYDKLGRLASVTQPDGTAITYAYDLFGRTVTSVDPDKGKTTTGYTPATDLVDWTQDARGKKRLFDYDLLGRKTAEYEGSRSDATKVAAWTYDSLRKGLADTSTRYEHPTSTTTRAYTQRVTKYDSMNRAATTVLDLPADEPLRAAGVPASLTFIRSWNDDGSLAGEIQPAVAGLGAEYLTHEYDALGYETRLPGTVERADYTPLGDLERMDLYSGLGHHVWVSDRYETGTRRLSQRIVGDDLHTWLPVSRRYGYDAAGNTTSVFEDATLGVSGATDYQCFTYDGYRRMTNVWTPKTADCASTGRATSNLGGAAPYWTEYAYDAAGQRKTETSRAATATVTTTYTYGSTAFAAKHGLASTSTVRSNVTGTVKQSYGYDASGNTTGRPGTTSGVAQTLTWDAAGRVAAVTEPASGSVPAKATGYLYDADGQLLIRRATTADGESVLYLGDTEVHLVVKGTTKTLSATRRIMFGGRVVQVKTGVTGASTVRRAWMVGDPQNTSTVALDADSLAVTRRFMTPFGAQRGAKPSWIDDHGFLDKPTDTTTGLTHLGAREYDPLLGRFLSVDPLLVVTDIQNCSGYVYGDNNPLAFSDPSGMANDACGGSPSCLAARAMAQGGGSSQSSRPAQASTYRRRTESCSSYGGGRQYDRPIGPPLPRRMSPARDIPQMSVASGGLYTPPDWEFWNKQTNWWSLEMDSAVGWSTYLLRSENARRSAEAATLAKARNQAFRDLGYASPEISAVRKSTGDSVGKIAAGKSIATKLGKTATATKWAGNALSAVSGYIAYQDYRADGNSRWKAGIKAGIVTGVSVAGAEMGAQVGSGLGTMVEPGPGTAVGGAIGAGVGGYLGNAISSWSLDKWWK